MKTLIMVLLLIFGFSTAQNTLAPDLASTVDTYVTEQMEFNGIPGVSLAIMQNGNVVYAKGYGLANVEHETPAKPETVYQLASVSKQFTAAGVLLLVQDGRIDLDASIRTYLTDAPETWQAITVRQILNHTAGLGDYDEGFDLIQPKTEEEILEYIYQSDLLFEPGSSFSYSNFGYITLSILVGQVSEQSFGDFMTERIFAPLEMTATTVISEQDIVMNRAQGYEYNAETGELENQSWVNPTLNVYGDGAFYSTVLDMAKWNAALYGADILSEDSKATLWQPLVLNNGATWPLEEAYGMGWSSGSLNGHAFVEHSGGWQGFATHFLRLTDDRLSVVVLSNVNEANSSEMARHVAELVEPDLALQAITDEPQITELVTTALTDLLTGELKPEMFTPEALAKTTELQILAKENAPFLGSVKEVSLLDRQDTPDNYQVYLYSVSFENAELRLELALTSEQKIASMRFN
jgi:CubicO group peptidase (beta-lactamase class C family)